MILPIHIAVALTSIACTTYLFVRPSRPKLYVSYGLLAGTLGSGTYLVASSSAHILQACIMGLVYAGAIAFGIASAQRRLATQKIRSR